MYYERTKKYYEHAKKYHERTKKYYEHTKKYYDRLVRFCQRARSAREIADRFGYNVTYMRRVYIRPLLEEKRLFLTMPDKPRSKQQRYVSGSRVDF
ncbi:DNA-binding protein [Bifidobacterium sp. DSM 109963]|uniref:DNA-binding protein n=1 Tax=Bifidobacterium panos TaxID=2675321 RepID=A0ABX1T0H8_9BIFI|nr:DNA-binding protein [Bifidobacterium sp. DSM 109963]